MCAKEVIIVNPDLKLLKKWEKRTYNSQGNNVCIVCGKKNALGPRKFTCSKRCHKKFLQELIDDFGEYKQIVDMATGKTHKVPIEDIFEHGIKQQDLKKYPVIEG
ncbi:unnamed protein product [marine sediment metagenome]|uniref:Uncharacterized protein n=1 Tax=marine sediment metagenome TaxID=412755 RepID=X1HTV3_9ZZZZ